MAASDAAASGAVTTSESLPSHYTYFGERGCSEHVSLMHKEWSDEGWRVDWVAVLKVGGDYKVTVTYGMPDDEKRSFTTTMWKEQSADWKPAGVSIKPRDENRLIMHWWRRTPSAKVHYNMKHLNIKDLPNDSEGASATGGDVAPRSSTDRRTEMAVDSSPMSVPLQTIAENVPVPSSTTSPSISSSAPSTPKRPRMTMPGQMTDDDADVV